MYKSIFGLALLGAVTVGTSAQAGSLPSQQAVQPVYWNGDYCGPRCQAHQWRRHERLEARREWHHRRWEERRSGYGYPGYGYPRY
jgi:hypothetical protein